MFQIPCTPWTLFRSPSALVVHLRCTPELCGAPGPPPLPSRPSSSGNRVTTTARIAPAAMATGSRQGAGSGAHAGVQQRRQTLSGPGRRRRPRQGLSTVHGGAIIVRRERCAGWRVQGVIGDLLLPSRSVATGAHGDASLRAGTWSMATNFLWCCISSILWCCISSNYSVTVRFLVLGMLTRVFCK